MEGDGDDTGRMTELIKPEIEGLYEDAASWHVNTGGETIHAKRIPGRFRTIKWFSALLWSVFFFGPYLRWNGQQAVLFDVPNRKFHLFSVTIWPQDVWMLSLVLILLAMTLFVVTAVAGRVFCGYFCFQTVWTDVYTWIEERIEGNPVQRRKLDAAPWSARKLRLKVFKHAIWLLIGVLTGITFTCYFADAFWLWGAYLSFTAPAVAWVMVAPFLFGAYVFAGFMREQVCFWLCPYARIQSVMVDRDSILPTYDAPRGEPRGRLTADHSDNHGDCVDCNLCVGVCPTGVDIRVGMQEGCITCGMCIDACDEVMEKVGKAKGLIRYMSDKEMDGEVLPAVWKRPRVLVYGSILLLMFSGIIYGLTHIPPVELSIVHERQPLFVQMKDGSIQNKYTIKAVNKTPNDMPIRLTVNGIPGLTVSAGDGEELVLKSGKMIPFHVFVRAMPNHLKSKKTPINFVIVGTAESDPRLEYESVFVGPVSGVR